jgi:hypothetical protein
MSVHQRNRGTTNGIEGRVSRLETEVRHLQGTVDEVAHGVKAIDEKVSGVGKMNWGLVFTLSGVIIAAMTMLGGGGWIILDMAMLPVKNSQESIAETITSFVEQSRRERERIERSAEKGREMLDDKIQKEFSGLLRAQKVEVDRLDGKIQIEMKGVDRALEIQIEQVREEARRVAQQTREIEVRSLATGADHEARIRSLERAVHVK